MKHSDKIWNLLQSENTFEMGMELFQTLGPLNPEIAYELFVNHNALEWFENNEDERFPNLIVDCFTWIASSDESVHQSYLQQPFTISLDTLNTLSVEQLLALAKMSQLNMQTSIKHWLKFKGGLPAQLHVHHFEMDCTNGLSKIGRLLDRVECVQLSLSNVPDTIEVISDVLEACPHLQSFSCDISDGLILWLRQHEEMEHSITSISTSTDVLHFHEETGTLFERVKSIRLAFCVSGQSAYSMVDFPNLKHVSIGDVIGNVISFVQEHSNIEGLELRQDALTLGGLSYKANAVLRGIVTRYGLPLRTASDTVLVSDLLFGQLPIDDAVRQRVDIGAQLRQWLNKGGQFVNGYNVEGIVSLTELDDRTVWTVRELQVLLMKIANVLENGGAFSQKVQTRLEILIQSIESEIFLDSLPLLQRFEQLGVCVCPREDGITLASALLSRYFPKEVDLSQFSWKPKSEFVDSYRMWWNEWRELPIHTSSIPLLEQMASFGLSSVLLDNVLMQQVHEKNRSQHITEWALRQLAHMWKRRDVSRQQMQHLIDMLVQDVETLAVSKLRLNSPVVQRQLITSLLRHKIVIPASEFLEINSIEQSKKNKPYGDWLVQQYTDLSELSEHGLKAIVVRLLKVLAKTELSFEDKRRFLESRFPEKYNNDWLYQPWSGYQAMRKFQSVIGPSGRDWLISGVTDLFNREQYVQESLAPSLFAKVSNKEWSIQDLRAFLLDQFQQGSKFRRYRSVPEQLYTELLYALRSNLSLIVGQKKLRFLLDILPVDRRAKVNLKPFKSHFLSWLELFTQSRRSQKLTWVIRDWLNKGFLTQAEYEEYLLASFKHGFGYAERISTSVYVDLFDVLNRKEIEIPPAYIPTVYQVAGKVNVDLQQFDAYLMEYRGIFDSHMSQTMSNRVLQLKSEGVWTREEYESYLLSNFQHRFYLFSWRYSPPKELYADLFEALKNTDCIISDYKLNTLAEIANRYHLDASLVHERILSIRSLFLGHHGLVKIVLQLKSEGVWTREEYESYLLSNFQHRFYFYSWPYNPKGKELYADLFEALKNTAGEIDTGQLQSLYEVAKQFGFDIAQFDSAVLQTKVLFSHYYDGIRNRLLSIFDQGHLEYDAYKALLLSNFTAQFSYNAKLPKQIYVSLFDALKDADVEITTSRLNTLYEVAEQFELDASQFDSKVLAFTELFSSRAVKHICQRILRLKSEGVWTREEYESYLLSNFQHRFHHHSTSSLPKEVVQDLFGALKGSEIEIDDEPLIELYRVADQFELDVQQFDGALIQAQNLFSSFYLPECAFLRVLQLVPEGVLQKSEYDKYLLDNFQYDFRGENLGPKELYEDLFEVLKHANADIDTHTLQVLYEVAEEFELDVAQFDDVLLNYNLLFDGRSIKIMGERVLELNNANGFSGGAYTQFLLSNFERSFVFSPAISPRLYTDLFEALKGRELDVSDRTLLNLYETATHHSLDASIFDRNLLEYTGLFKRKSLSSMGDRFCELYSKEQITQEEYYQRLRQNFEKHFSVHQLQSKRVFQDLCASLNGYDSSVPLVKLKSLYHIANQYSIDVSQFDEMLKESTSLFGYQVDRLLWERILKLVSSGALSQSEYQALLLSNVQTMFYFNKYPTLQKSKPSKVYVDLFETLKDADIQLDARTLSGLYEVGQHFALNVSQFDEMLKESTSLFDYQVNKLLWERILKLVSSGALSQSEYQALLLSNVQNMFCFNKWSPAPENVYVALFEVLPQCTRLDVGSLDALIEVAQKYSLNDTVLANLLSVVENGFQASEGMVKRIETWRVQGTVSEAVFDAFLMKAVERVQWSSDIPKAWYERTISLVDASESIVTQDNLVIWVQILLTYELSMQPIDAFIQTIDSRKALSRAVQEEVPKYLLLRANQGQRIEVPSGVWFFCVKPTDEEVISMVQLYSEGWTLFPTYHILQHVVHQVPKSPDGEAYIQACTAHWAQQTGKAWFEGWPMEMLQVGLQAIPSDIRQLDILSTSMSVLPVECQRFTHLQKLFVYNTDMSHLRSEVQNFSTVEVLSVSNTSVDVTEVLSMPSLRKLYCKNVSISSEQQRLFSEKNVELRF